MSCCSLLDVKGLADGVFVYLPIKLKYPTVVIVGTVYATLQSPNRGVRYIYTAYTPQSPTRDRLLFFTAQTPAFFVLLLLYLCY